MKAIVYTNYGSPDVLQLKEVNKPVLKANEILVSVKAAGVNRTDCANLTAKPFIMRFLLGFFKPKKQIMGTTFSGVVVAKSAQVTNFNIGDKIFGFNDAVLSSYAEFLSISATGAIAIIPENISYTDIVACIEGEHYARNFMNKAKINKGHKILVNGATGAIGSALVQFLKALEVDVTAVANTKNIALIKSLGANRVIDYQKEDFTKKREQYDYIFDAVGKSSFGKCKAQLKPKGAYISSELGFLSQNIFLSLITPLFRGRHTKFPIPLNPQASLAYVSKLLTENKYMPVIDKTYPLEETADAFRYVLKGEKTANVVIVI